jgi:hypothetical protein
MSVWQSIENRDLNSGTLDTQSGSMSLGVESAFEPGLAYSRRVNFQSVGSVEIL